MSLSQLSLLYDSLMARSSVGPPALPLRSLHGLSRVANFPFLLGRRTGGSRSNRNGEVGNPQKTMQRSQNLQIDSLEALFSSSNSPGEVGGLGETISGTSGEAQVDRHLLY